MASEREVVQCIFVRGCFPHLIALWHKERFVTVSQSAQIIKRISFATVQTCYNHCMRL